VFDVHQPVYDRHGEHDEAKVKRYIDGLMQEFANSPEAQPVIEEYGPLNWAAMMMQYALDYLGATPPKMSLRDFNEVVFSLFPRKVAVEPESAPEIIAELRAFWTFLQRQYGLKNAAQILASLNAGAADRLRAELANPANYGMAKSFVTMGQQAGFDMTTQEGIAAFMQAYNSGVLGRHMPFVGDDDEDYWYGAGW
jgi:hypothetical protein